MPTVYLFSSDPEEDPSEFEFEDNVWLENGIARVDGIRHVGVEGMKVEA